MCAKEDRNIREATVETDKSLASEERFESFSRGSRESISFPGDLAESEYFHGYVKEKSKEQMWRISALLLGNS